MHRNAWLAVLRCELPADAYRRVLVKMHDAIIPAMPNPLLLADFLSASVDQGESPSTCHVRCQPALPAGDVCAGGGSCVIGWRLWRQAAPPRADTCFEGAHLEFKAGPRVCAGGMTGMLALNGLFILVTRHGLEYPAFFRRLYGLLTLDAFQVRGILCLSSSPEPFNKPECC